MDNQDTRVMSAPHFPYDENTMLLQHEDKGAADGGMDNIINFVKNDPYVKKGLVEDYTIREFKLSGCVTEFDRLAKKYVNRS